MRRRILTCTLIQLGGGASEGQDREYPASGCNGVRCASEPRSERNETATTERPSNHISDIMHPLIDIDIASPLASRPSYKIPTNESCSFPLSQPPAFPFSFYFFLFLRT